MKKGGTVGYLSSLLDGMQAIGTFESDNGLRHAFLFPDIGPDDRLPNVPIGQLKFNTPFDVAYDDTHHLKFSNKQDWFHSSIPMSEAMKVNLKNITSVHIHGAYNFLPVYNFLRLCGIENDVVKILTTHNPWKPEEEDIFHFNKHKSPAEIERDLPKEAAYRHFLKMRDEFAFRMSDVLFFPSEHSMDGYYNSWPEFEEIVKDKPVYFSATGTEAKEVLITRSAMRKSLGIPEDARVFLYLGRFIPMRGFDLYSEVAKKILKKHENAYFLAVGEKRDKPAVNHSRWIEVAHTPSPGDFLNMADACVMANRGSYFDLSMVEALAQGIFLIAAKVGGYKYLEGKTKGVSFFTPESTDELFAACDNFCTLDIEKLDVGMQENLSLYKREMTPEKFAQGYLDTIDTMYADLSIKPKNRDIARMCYSAYPQEKIAKGQVAPAPAPVKQPTVASKVRLNLPKYKTKADEGIALYEKGLFQKAVYVFYEAIETEPKAPRLRRQLAEVLFTSGSRGEALKQLDLAKKEIPNNKNLQRRFLKMKYGRLAFWLKNESFL
jgi:glycosyltransferase involved in cell wall biosynthesis